MEKIAEKYVTLIEREEQLKEELERTREELHRTGRELNKMLPDERGVIVEILGKRKCLLKSNCAPIIIPID